jgi:hypothetical protein
MFPWPDILPMLQDAALLLGAPVEAAEDRRLP